MKPLKDILEKEDSSIAFEMDQLVELIDHQEEFDKLFKYIFSDQRVIALRAIDTVEKITRQFPNFLDRHETELVNLLDVAAQDEIKLHLSQLLPRIDLRGGNLVKSWNHLMRWAKDKTESTTVRVQSLQVLYEIQKKHPQFREDLEAVIDKVKNEDIESANVIIKQFSFNGG